MKHEAIPGLSFAAQKKVEREFSTWNEIVRAGRILAFEMRKRNLFIWEYELVKELKRMKLIRYFSEETYRVAELYHKIGVETDFPYEINNDNIDRYDSFENVSKKDYKKVLDAISALPERVAEVFRLRTGFFDGHKWRLNEITKKLGISREEVRKNEAAAIDLLDFSF